MTHQEFDKRLDAITEKVYNEAYKCGVGARPYHEYRSTELVVAEAKQAITSLIKELVAEAKAGTWVEPEDTDDLKWQGYVDGIIDFEQNILKELEEV